MRNVSDKICRGNPLTFCSVTFFFQKSCRLWDNVEKYCTAGHGWQYGACALHAGYLKLKIHTLSGCVILIALPQPTMIARTRLYVTLYVYCLSGITLIKGSEIAKRTERFTTAVTNYLQNTGTVLSPQIWKRHAK